MEDYGEVKGHLTHGHSQLIWLLDDIHAHLEGLMSDTEARQLIFLELISFSRSFTDALHEHIEEEETDVFPVLADLGLAEAKERIAEMEAQHRTLEETVDGFWENLEELRETASECGWEFDKLDDALTDLVERAEAVRQHLRTHRIDERRFLTEMQQYVTEDPKSRPEA